MGEKVRHIVCLLLVLFSGTIEQISAQIYDADGQYVDTIFHDHVNRQADDFIKASLVVADPGDVLYSVLGHACIRMQCPTFGLDNCFSYESEDVHHKVFSFLAGNLNMKLQRILFDQYCEEYAAEGRGVKEYELYLSPSQKQRLWQVLDRHAEKEQILPYDYYHRGCAKSCVEFMHEALGNTPIEYSPWPEKCPTGRDLGKKNTTNALWVRFVVCFISGTEVDVPLEGEQQLIIPTDLVAAWQSAHIDGHPILSKEAHVLVESHARGEQTWFTPVVAALLMVFLVLLGWYVGVPYADWFLLVVNTIFGAVLTYLIFFSDLCCTSWNWMIIAFNPLPLLLWHWRKYWALPYAVLLLIWLMAIVLYPHTIVDWSHWILVVAMVVMYIKQWFIHRTE